MLKFNNKRRYQWDLMYKWLKRNQNLSKTQLSKKMGVSRVTLNKIFNEYLHSNKDFKPFSRQYANNRIPDTQRINIWNETTNFLIKLNENRRKTKFIPTFGMLKSFVLSSDDISLRSFSDIIKENNFYLPWCTRKTKKDIRKQIKIYGKVSPIIQDLMKDIEEIKTTRIYKKKSGIQGDILEIDACQHPWFNDESYHLYRVVDSATGTRLAQYVEKEETSIGYLRMLKKFFKEHGVPRVIIADKRKSFWNGEENGSQISLMLMELDIEVITSSEPTAKPNIERSFLDAQQLYPLLCYTKDITNLEQFKRLYQNLWSLVTNNTTKNLILIIPT